MGKITSFTETSLKAGDWVQLSGEARISAINAEEIVIVVKAADLREAWVAVGYPPGTQGYQAGDSLILTPRDPALEPLPA